MVVPTTICAPTISTPPALIATTSSYDSAQAQRKKSLQATRKFLNRLPADKKDELKARKREKVLERILLPDTPPSKRKRPSPDRAPCWLVPGTPEVPALRRIEPWDVVETTLKIFGEDDNISTIESVVAASTAFGASNLLVDWSTDRLKDNSWTLCVPPPLPTAQPQDETKGPAVETALTPLQPTPTAPQPQDDTKGPAVEAALTPPQPPPTAPQPQDETKGPATEVAPTPPQLAHASYSFEPQPSCSYQRHAADVSTETGMLAAQQRLDVLMQEEDEEDDVDDDDFAPERIAGEMDFINESPAILPANIDTNGQAWLSQEDCAADKVVVGLLSEREDQLIFNWSHSPDAFLGQREVFRGQPGPTFPIESNTTPIEVFRKYFDDELLDYIVTETNRNIKSIQQPLQQNSRFVNIKPTTRDEIAVFLAVLIFQGLCSLTVEKDYFRENGFLTMPHFKRLMSYNRFVVLKRLLHFADSEISTGAMTPDERKLRIFGPLLDRLNRKFSELYRPSRDIVIDESLLKWHGRLSFSQKIATKAAKVGIKSYELCESSSGYLWKFFIYMGEGKSEGQMNDIGDDDHDDVTAPKNATSQIVIDLVRPLLNLGHTLTMDNFYNSPLLARFLKSHGTDCMGTLRVNREHVPECIKDVLKRELRQGEIVQSYCRDMSVVLWRDQNIVSMISTFHGGEKKKFGTYRYKPQVVLDYNLSMGGVDRKDQLLSAHPMERSRNVAWYKKMFRRLLNVTILNAYIVFKTKNPHVPQHQFRVRLANELVRTFHPTIAHPLPTPDEVKVVRLMEGKRGSRPILTGNHFVGKGTSRLLTCVWCHKSRTAYTCKQCDVSLCLIGCFEQYHTKR